MNFDLFVVPQFFDLRLCETILAELKTLEGNAATLYGRNTTGFIDERARKTLRLKPAEETVKLVVARLWECKEAVEKHFAVTLKECEDPQFLRYREGDFFVAHQDGNTGMLNLDTEQRLISTVIILSRESEQPEADTHSGGSLVFSDLDNKFRPPVEPGTLIAFRSETTHEVTPVTHGERFSIASWYR
ncbi:MAG TPA: 2OG-Fe(II) oxygenase [Pyrinomonadaceae bacterium]|jgi:predicted 2-oxoglutarate/Fe(II)-dependent dioxygenase YbiX|nr:2OG-Fe(II) oxygenase [Pyrinomonadaceae bacterium]